MHKYVDFIVKFIQDTGEALIGLTGTEWSCEVRQGSCLILKIFPPFVVMVVSVRSKASVRPRIFDDVVILEVVKGGVFSFIGRGRTKGWMLLCESNQYWFQFFSMLKTRMPHSNIMKKFQCEVIQLCEIFGGTIISSWASGSFQSGWVVQREYGRTSWGLDHFSSGVVDPCCYGFLRLAAFGHVEVKITR